MCNDFLLWWLVETRLILQGIIELLLELGWYLIKFGVLRTWSPPLNFNCPSAVLGNCPQLGWDHLSRWALRCGILTRLFFIHLLKVCNHKSSFPTFLSPRTRRIRGVIRVILCSRIGGISRGQKQKWSAHHSNEPNENSLTQLIRWSAFLLVFFADSCNSSWNPSTVEWSIATVTQRFRLYSAYRYSAIPHLFERWGVDETFQWFHGQLHRLMPNSRKWFHVGLEKFCFITDL